MESKNLCASEDLPLGTIQSRSAYSRSKAGCSPSSARNLMATPPRSLSVAPSFSACSVVRRASSTTSDLVLPVLPLSPLMLRRPQLSGLLGSPLSPSPVARHGSALDRPASLSLLRLSGGGYPGLDDAPVVFEPVADALLRVGQAGRDDLRLEVVDLPLVERDGLEEGVGRGVVVGQIPVDYGGDLGRVVEAALEVSGVFKVAQVVASVHPVGRPAVEHHGLTLSVGLLELGEHSRGAPLDQHHLQLVSGDDLVLYLRVDGRAGLDPDYEIRPRPVERGEAADVHVVRYGEALGGLPHEPRVEVFNVVLDLAQVVFVVGHPHVLEGVKVALGDVPEDLLYHRFVGDP